MSRLLAILTGVATVLGAAPLTLAQGEGDFPPVIDETGVVFGIWRYTAVGYVPDLADPPDVFDPSTQVASEGDLMVVIIPFEDLDLGEVDENGNRTKEQEFWARKQSLWLLDFPLPPEPPPVEGDTAIYFRAPNLIVDDPPATTGLFAFIFQIPEFNGPSQARLRDPLNHPYDVGWLVEICLSNEQEPEPGLASCISFLLLAKENFILRPPNPPTFADAGPDQTVALNTLVTLDARGTFDAWNIGFDPYDDPNVFEKDRLTFVWEWVSGPARVDPTQTSIYDPRATVTLAVRGDYEYRVIATDGFTVPPSVDTVNIFARNASELPSANRRPVASAVGPAANVTVGQFITLDGRGSSDPDGHTLSFRWKQTNEVGGELTFEEVAAAFQPISGLKSSVSTWRAVTPGTYYFLLVVTDPYGLSSSTPVTVTVVSGTAGQTVNRATAAGTDGGAPTAPAPVAPLGCGAGLAPLLVVPLVLRMMRGRFR